MGITIFGKVKMALLSFWRRDVYTASLDDFKPEYFNLILLRALNDIEKDDIVEIMRLVWA